jgi:phosphatidylglycerol lysyltransferase
LLTKFGRSALDYFKLWHDKSFFFTQSRNCFLAYRVGGNFAVVLADPVGPEEEIGEVVQSFTKFCNENDWGVGFHQTLPDFLPVYTRSGFKKLKIGDDAIVDLTKFTLEGKIGKEFRNTTTRLEKLGIHIRSFDPPISDEIVNQIKAISDEWLQTPGRRERSFTLGMFETNYVRTTPLLTAVDKDERILAFMNIIPSYCKGEATIDLMRRRTEAPNGIMDYLFAKLFFLCREQGYHRFNLGMAPMSGFQEREETSVEEKAIHFFFQRLNFIFSFTGLKQYKAKFADYWEPRYAIYRNIFDLPKFASALGKVSELKDE